MSTLKKTYLLVIVLLGGLALNVSSQPADSAINKNDSTIIEKKSPLKATIYSSILPGAGQVYNRKFWKVPIIYVGVGSFSYLAIKNQNEFVRYRSALIIRQDEQSNETDEFDGILSESAIENEMDRFRRYRDLNIIGATLIYVLQIIDANVDASLSDFDVSSDLSIKLSPKRNFQADYLAVGLTYRF